MLKSNKNNVFDMSLFKWKAGSIVALIILMVLLFIINFFDIGTNEYGSIFSKLHYKTKYWIQECSDANCKFIPAEIEVIKRYRTSIGTRVYLIKVYGVDGEDIYFRESLVNISYTDLPIFEALRRFNSQYVVDGCFADHGYMGKFVQCSDTSGKIWNLRIPKTNEIKDLYK